MFRNGPRKLVRIFAKRKTNIKTTTSMTDFTTPNQKNPKKLRKTLYRNIVLPVDTLERKIAALEKIFVPHLVVHLCGPKDHILFCKPRPTNTHPTPPTVVTINRKNKLHVTGFPPT